MPGAHINAIAIIQIRIGAPPALAGGLRPRGVVPSGDNVAHAAAMQPASGLRGSPRGIAPKQPAP
jgi:hypothetical protein